MKDFLVCCFSSCYHSYTNGELLSCVDLAQRPASTSQHDVRPKPSADTQLPTERRARNKFGSIKSSGYGQAAPASKLTASKSAYSPTIKQHSGEV